MTIEGLGKKFQEARLARGLTLDEAARMQGAGAMAASVPEDQVAVCSTGVIGVHLPGDQIIGGLNAAGSPPSRGKGSTDRAEAPRLQ